MVLAAIIAAGASSQAKADLIVNGGFETGDFTGWTHYGNTGATFVSSGPNSPEEGSYAAQLGPVGSLGFLAQTLATTAGASYEISFAWGTIGGPINEFRVTWDGNILLDYTNFTPSDYPDYQVFNLTETASTDSTVLEFGFRQDPSYQGLDAVSVNAVPGPVPEPVPEPASGFLLGLGGVGMTIEFFRRRLTLVCLNR